MLGKFIESEEIKPVLTKYFVITHLELGDAPQSNPGAKTFLQEYGGADKGAPFLAFVSSDRKLIINSLDKTGSNIGYPAEPHEIDWFMEMLKKASPQMTSQERETIEKKLRSYKRK